MGSRFLAKHGGAKRERLDALRKMVEGAEKVSERQHAHFVRLGLPPPAAPKVERQHSALPGPSTPREQSLAERRAAARAAIAAKAAAEAAAASTPAVAAAGNRRTNKKASSQALPSPAPAHASVPFDAASQRVWHEALQRYPYLRATEGLQAVRELIAVRRARLLQGERPEDALRAAIEEVVPKYVPK